MSRHPKDKDFVETTEGLLFTVVGYLHPPDAYTAYLKYRPDAEGKWERQGTHYRRMLQVYSAAEVKSSIDWLRENHPEYVSLDTVRGFELTLVPWKNTVAYYLPEVRLIEILNDPQDPLESKVSALVTLLSEASGVPMNRFGITGSLLLEIHNPMFSDIDLLVYGREHAQQIRDTMDQLFGENKVKPYSPDEIRGWQHRQAQTLGIPEEFGVNSDHNSIFLDGSRFSYHITYPTRDEMINQGYPADIINSIPSHTTKQTHIKDHVPEMNKKMNLILLLKVENG